jgi:hypothetical protein
MVIVIDKDRSIFPGTDKETPHQIEIPLLSTWFSADVDPVKALQYRVGNTNTTPHFKSYDNLCTSHQLVAIVASAGCGLINVSV